MAESRQAAIACAALRREYGDRAALDGIDFELAPGQTLAVLGPNGAGKTTLLRILATLLRPSGGEASVLGCSLPGDAWRLRGRVGYVGHEPLLYRDLTARENLRFCARLHGLDEEAAAARTGELLGAAGLARRGDERVDALSAGLRQRVAICRAVLHEPELLLLDEPDANLDADGRELARSLLGSAPARSRVLVSHDAERALADADRALVLDRRGRTAYEGAAGELDPGEARAAVVGAAA